MKAPVVSSLAALAAGVLWLSCSSSTSPKPSVAGTWHVTVGAMSKGVLSPTSFDVTVTASADTFIVSMPTVTWQLAPLPPETFGSKAGTVSSSNPAVWGVWKGVTAGATPCGSFTVMGTLNADKTALSSVTVTAGDSTAVISGNTYCVPQASGTGTAAK